MTRILYWNVQDFSINKINDPRFGIHPHTVLTRAQASADRRWLIHQVIAAANPDIITIVELESGWTAVGNLATGNAPNVALTLLADLQGINPNWCLVPPLRTGPSEGVLVYFRQDRLAFCGPYQWSGGAGPSQAAPMAPAAYGDGYAAALPAGPVPAGAPNAGMAQNMLAARVSDYTNSLASPVPGGALTFDGRQPYCTQFAEITPGGAYVRTITLFSIHAGASYIYAVGYLDDLVTCAEVVDAIGANEVRVVVGDFNLNLMSNTPPRPIRAEYAAMTAAPGNYTLGITPAGPSPAPPAGNPPPAGEMYDAYYATHIKGWYNASYWSTGGQTQYYPGYGTIGADLLTNLYAIDNIFYRYGGGLAPPPAHDVTILNPITGTPYHNLDALYPAPPVQPLPPMGPTAMASTMANMLFNPAPLTAAPYHVATVGQFRNWINYGHIRSTSDHLPIVAVV